MQEMEQGLSQIDMGLWNKQSFWAPVDHEAPQLG